MEFSDTWIIVFAVGVSIFGIIAYLAFMIFLPEWVGITGKTALKNQEAHRGPQETPPEVAKPAGKE